MNESVNCQQWAVEAIKILNVEESLAEAIHCDFEDIETKVNTVVAVSQPDSFKMRTGITRNALVELNEQLVVRVRIPDSELQQTPFSDLVTIYLHPMIKSLARTFDTIILDCVSQSSLHSLPGLTHINIRDSLKAASEILDQNRAPATNRTLLLGMKSEAEVLKVGLPLTQDYVYGFRSRMSATLDKKANFAWHRDALALVTRPAFPLDQRLQNASFVVSGNGIGLRASLKYEVNKGMCLSIEMLAGVAILDPTLVIAFIDE